VPQGEVGDLVADGAQEWIVLQDDGAGAASGRGTKGPLEVGGAADLASLDLEPECSTGSVEHLHGGACSRVDRKQEHRHTGEAWEHLLDELEALADELGREAGEPGDVASRPREARREAVLGRVAAGAAHDRDVPGRLPGRERHERLPDEDDVDLLLDELLEDRAQLVARPVRAGLDDDRLARPVAEVSEPSDEAVLPPRLGLLVR
jgi:hypothetical protein